MSEAVIFIGVQGAGKSTFYRERFSDTHVRINLDMLKTRRREQLIFDACIAAGQSFVIDNTNPLPGDRVRYATPAKAAGFRVVAHFFSTPLNEALRRNNLRQLKQKIPAAALAGTFKKTQRPTLAEGFDEIHTMELTPENQFVVI
jgi:predicted kinase